MAKLNLSMGLPRAYELTAMMRILRDIETQLNSLSEGRIYAAHSAASAPP